MNQASMTPGAQALRKHRHGLATRLDAIDRKLAALLVAVSASGVVLPDTTIATAITTEADTLTARCELILLLLLAAFLLWLW